MSGPCPATVLGILELPIQCSGRVRGLKELESEKPANGTVIHILKWTERHMRNKKRASAPASFLDTKDIHKGNLEVHLLRYSNAPAPSATGTSVQRTWMCMSTGVTQHAGTFFTWQKLSHFSYVRGNRCNLISWQMHYWLYDQDSV